MITVISVRSGYQDGLSDSPYFNPKISGLNYPSVVEERTEDRIKLQSLLNGFIKSVFLGKFIMKRGAT